MVPLFVITAAGSIVIFSLAAILLKYTIPEIGGSVQFATLQFCLGLVLHIILLVVQIIFQQKVPSITLSQILLILLASVFGFIGFLSYIFGLEVGNASVGAVVLSSRVFIAVPLGIIFLSEVYQPLVYVGIFLAFIGSVVVSWQSNLSFIQVIKFQSPGIKLFIMTALFWSLQNLIIRQLNNTVPLLFLLTIRITIFSIFSVLLYYYLTRYQDRPRMNITTSSLQKTIIYVIISIISQLGLVYALGENLSITETIGVFEGTLTFIFSLIFVKLINNDVLQEELEKRTITIKVIGIILSITGTLLTISLI